MAADQLAHGCNDRALVTPPRTQLRRLCRWQADRRAGPYTARGRDDGRGDCHHAQCARASARHMGSLFEDRPCMCYGSCGVCRPGTRLDAIRHAGPTAPTPWSEPPSYSTSFLAQSRSGCDKEYSAGGKWGRYPLAHQPARARGRSLACTLDAYSFTTDEALRETGIMTPSPNGTRSSTDCSAKSAATGPARRCVPGTCCWRSSVAPPPLLA